MSAVSAVTVFEPDVDLEEAPRVIGNGAKESEEVRRHVTIAAPYHVRDLKQSVRVRPNQANQLGNRGSDGGGELVDQDPTIVVKEKLVPPLAERFKNIDDVNTQLVPAATSFHVLGLAQQCFQLVGVKGNQRPVLRDVETLDHVFRHVRQKGRVAELIG